MTLKRETQEMPDDVAKVLSDRNLRDKYDDRPAYQRNDYLMWIGKAKQDDTRQRRINQMLDELEQGDVYMKMAWSGGSTSE